ncbi:MAG: hypothetical protein AXW12_09645 [Thalassospira sp. Nap_22]|nr:MAG: hypothetical protein AXW12_09645 [Thalassospira sp. Nap_22]
MKSLLKRIYGPFDAKRRKDMMVDLATFITIIAGSLTVYGFFAPDRAVTQLVKIANTIDELTDAGMMVELPDLLVDAHLSERREDDRFDLSISLLPSSKEIENISLKAYDDTGTVLGSWSINYVNVGSFRSLDSILTSNPSKVILCYSYTVDSSNKIVLKTTGRSPQDSNNTHLALPDLKKPLVINKEPQTTCEQLVTDTTIH